MLFYFVVFVSLGSFLAYILNEKKTFWILTVAIAVIWSFLHHPIWGAVSFVEILIGYFLVTQVFKVGNLIDKE
jgi:hypothetical protein